MECLFVGNAVNKDTLGFRGYIAGNKVDRILVSNRTFEEGKSYMVHIKDIEFVGKNIVCNVVKMKEV